MSVSVKVTKRITIKCPIPATVEETRDFFLACAKAGEEGLVLVNATSIQEGQRDPYTVGLAVTFGLP